MATQTVILTTSVAPYGGAVTQVLVRSQAVTGPTGPQGATGPTGPQGPAGTQPVATYLGTATSNVSSTLADATTPIAGLSFSVTAGTTYEFRGYGNFQSASTTTGILLGYSSTVAVDWAVSAMGANGVSTQFILFASSGLVQNTTANARAIGTDLPWTVSGALKASANGTVAIGFGTEVAGSAITMRPGSVLIVTTCT